MAKSVRIGFSLLELVAAIAIVAILLTLIVPAVVAARQSALTAKTKVQLQQYIIAAEAYRFEYGHYPPPLFGLGEQPVNLAHNNNWRIFMKALSARTPAGLPLSPGECQRYNPKSITFYHFTEEELVRNTSGRVVGLRTPIGDTPIHLIADTDGDGWIRNHLPTGADSQHRTTVAKSIVAYVVDRDGSGHRAVLSYD